MIQIASQNDIEDINKIGVTFVTNFITTYQISNYIDNDKYIVLVNKDSKVNAFLIILKNIDCYELEMLVVAKNYRNLGIASKMLDYFIKNYLKKGDEIFLEVAIDNQIAFNLYQKYGFSIVNLRKKYYNGVDAYVMKKVIS